MIIDLAHIYRGKDIESIHYGIACLANSREVIKTWGDSSFASYTRSLIKPLQLTAALKAGLKLDNKLLAIACASHKGLDMHIQAVQDLMQEFGLKESDLVCGTASQSRGKLKSPIFHNCSGKHSAILAACKINNWDLANYFDSEHQINVLISDELKRLSGLTDISHAVDGCGLPTFYMQLADMAKTFASMAQDESYTKAFAAMHEYPELVGSPSQIDSLIMKACPGKLIAKVGAEGAIVVINLERAEALLLKIIDGSYRARAQVVLSLLEYLAWLEPGAVESNDSIYNSRGDVVGSIQTRSDWN